MALCGTLSVRLAVELGKTRGGGVTANEMSAETGYLRRGRFESRGGFS